MTLECHVSNTMQFHSREVFIYIFVLLAESMMFSRVLFHLVPVHSVCFILFSHGDIRSRDCLMRVTVAISGLSYF